MKLKERNSIPTKIIPLGDGKYKVETPNMVHAKSTTLEKAKSQGRLLNSLEAGFKPKSPTVSARGMKLHEKK